MNQPSLAPLLACLLPFQEDEYEDGGEYELGRANKGLMSRHMRSVARAFRGSFNSSRSDNLLDADEVSKQLLTQFGEVVLRHELPKPPTMTLRKAEDAKMKVRGIPSGKEWGLDVSIAELARHAYICARIQS